MEAFVKYLYGYNVEEVLCANGSDGQPTLQLRRLLKLYDTAEKHGMPPTGLSDACRIRGGVFEFSQWPPSQITIQLVGFYGQRHLQPCRLS